MSTISVTVDQTDKALMLVEWLKSIRFVKDVKVGVDVPVKKGNAGEIIKMFDEMRGKNYFAGIDPIKYQNQYCSHSYCSRPYAHNA